MPSTASSAAEKPFQTRILHSYGDHPLQVFSVWLNNKNYSVLKAEKQYWLIYIHGGAWRDPSINEASLQPTIDALLSLSPAAHIAGFASIDYRLSPHPDFPSNGNTARHPDHVVDVRKAISVLQQIYGFSHGDYILVGHSCGATLAFQTAMDPERLGLPQEEINVKVATPAAIVGVAGIYDLRKLRDSHKNVLAYQGFITGAFGVDESVWDSVSPSRELHFDKMWKTSGLVVLAHSRGDELIDEEQILSMAEALRETQTDAGGMRVVCLKGNTALSGGHDEMWEKGSEVAEVIALTLNHLIW